MSREHILHKVRTALGRSAGQGPPPPPPARIVIPQVDMEQRIVSVQLRVEALAGTTARAATLADACDIVAAAIEGQTAVASNAPYLAECGIASLPGVRSGITDREELREACAFADVGITSADYVLGDTGTLVMRRALRKRAWYRCSRPRTSQWCRKNASSRVSTNSSRCCPIHRRRLAQWC